MNNEPVAIRYDFDGYGYQYMDSGSGSDWQTRVDGELLYTNPACKHGVDDGACKECYQEATEPLAWIKKKEIGYMEVTKKCGAKDYATNLGLVPEDDDIPLYIHPAKELHLSLQKSKQTGELLAVTYTDDEHRIVEVLWQRPPVKELTLTDEKIDEVYAEYRAKGYKTLARAILRKASNK